MHEPSKTRFSKKWLYTCLHVHVSHNFKTWLGVVRTNTNSGPVCEVFHGIFVSGIKMQKRVRFESVHNIRSYQTNAAACLQLPKFFSTTPEVTWRMQLYGCDFLLKNASQVCRQICQKSPPCIGIRLQVPNLCMDLDLSLFYILMMWTRICTET